MALEHEYPLSPTDLFGTVTDLDYLRARHARFGGVGTPEVESGDYLVVVRGSRQLPVDKIPSAARPFLGDGIIVQEDVWTLPDDDDGPVTATWQAHVGGAPAKLGGEHRIEAAEAGSLYTITADVSIRVPLLGGRLEQQVSGYLDLLISKELDFLADWIAEHR
jgi:Protein of unknown function (DUF2505)